MKGVVRNLLDYGAFVNVGGIDGMLHVAEISYGRVNKPSDVLTVGQEIEVRDPEGGRPQEAHFARDEAAVWSIPGPPSSEKYKAGDRVKGTVSRLADFGALSWNWSRASTD